MKQIKKIRIIAYLFFVIYLLLLFHLTVIGRLGKEGIIEGSNYLLWNRINLIPFKSIYAYLFHPRSIKTEIINIGGNILAFIPLGFILPVLNQYWKSYRRIIMISIFTSVFIEAIQGLLRVGSSDIDDVILNLMGGLIGYFLFYISLGRLNKGG